MKMCGSIATIDCMHLEKAHPSSEQKSRKPKSEIKIQTDEKSLGYFSNRRIQKNFLALLVKNMQKF